MTDFIRALRVARGQQARPVADDLAAQGWDLHCVSSELFAVTGVSVLLSAQGWRAWLEHPAYETVRPFKAVVIQSSDGEVGVACANPFLLELSKLTTQVLPNARLFCATAQALAELDAVEELSQKQGSVIELVDSAIAQAHMQGASDIHFEVSRTHLHVKFRQDGVLRSHLQLEGVELASEVISRIKVMAHLDITEQRVPQDGRFRCATPGGEVDLRVSVMPSVHGEDAVLRLLDKSQLRGSTEGPTLKRLGFDQSSDTALRHLASLPHGMTLVTGPTGSGKTTTVYAILAQVNTGAEKVITIEDPVEYELPGVLQIPVNEKKGLTFAKGLRSILRHDPDRILVGEIRDPETAEIAVQSALTGHQVFTTVHANNLFDVMGRFRHFGLDMFSFMSALNAVVVQRLVRSVCPHCVSVAKPSPEEAAWLHAHGMQAANVAKPVGCKRCGHTGYSGRTVLAEVHTMDDEYRDLVIGEASVTLLREKIRSTSVPLLADLAARMVAQGKTTREEISRVVGL